MPCRAARLPRVRFEADMSCGVSASGRTTPQPNLLPPFGAQASAPATSSSLWTEARDDSLVRLLQLLERTCVAALVGMRL